MKNWVLFICVHNSARSQMAEAWLNKVCSENFEAQSAGLEPGRLNPLVVQVMAEAGIEISEKKPQGVFDVFKSGQLFAYVITVCDENSAQRNVQPSPGLPPVFTGVSPIHRKWKAAKPRSSTRPDYSRPDSGEDRIMVRRNQRTSCDCGGLAVTNWARDQLQQVSPDDVDRIHNWPNRYRRQNGKENGFYCLKTDIFSPEIMPADIANRPALHLPVLSDSKNSDDVWRVHDDENSAPNFVMSCHKVVKGR
jgi:protein-tyrosine-phosphatase